MTRVINMSVKGIDYITYRTQENARELWLNSARQFQRVEQDLELRLEARQDDKYMAFRTHLLGELAPRKQE